MYPKNQEEELPQHWRDLPRSPQEAAESQGSWRHRSAAHGAPAARRLALAAPNTETFPRTRDRDRGREHPECPGPGSRGKGEAPAAAPLPVAGRLRPSEDALWRGHSSSFLSPPPRLVPVALLALLYGVRQSGRWT